MQSAAIGVFRRALGSSSRSPTALLQRPRFPSACTRPASRWIRSLSTTPEHDRRDPRSASTPVLPALLTTLPQYISTLRARLKPILQPLSNIRSRVIATPQARLMRLHAPIGTHLLFLPCAWSITLASTPSQALTLLPLFYLGSTFLRGAGCTVNDILDVDVDRQVERTKKRPIAAGEVSVGAAVALLMAQLAGGVGVLTRLNEQCFLVACITVLPAMLYPTAKRYTAYPQAVLAGVFNSGAIMGYVAATGTVALPAVFLYGAGFCWTMVYDTIYAKQDHRDDSRIGIGTTALSFGSDATTRIVLSAFAAGKFACLMAAGATTGMPTPYYMGITASMMHLVRQIFETDFDDPLSCHEAFVSNQTTGLLTCSAILAGRLF